MQFIVFILLYPFLWFISVLPFRLLYAVSDAIYLLIYYVIGYRRKIVRQNIQLALPHLSKKEQITVEKKSYRHMCDMFLEMIKTMTISEKELDKRFVFTNIDVLTKMEQEGKSIAVMMAHYASYEWAISLNKFSRLTSYAIYKKIANRHFDKLVKDIRLKFKAILITTRETIPTIEKNYRENHLGLYGFASDQSPQLSKTHHWGTFMGIETPVHTGAEMLAKRFDMNVIFLKVKKVKRGHYQATFELMFDQTTAVPNYEISDEFLRRVEKQIYEAPEYYLWTHKRWKHKKK
jgi:KDO2-lipid IV(A) lauroyltransferase